MTLKANEKERRTIDNARMVAAVMILVAPAAIPAQTFPDTGTFEYGQPINTAPQGRVATSQVGEVGKRITRDTSSTVMPLARIENRIQSRVASRISNRIDRQYQPDAQSSSVDPVDAIRKSEKRTRR